MENQQTAEMSYKDLDELCEALNAMSDEEIDRLDVTSLPVFGPDIENTHGIFSWDEARQMIQPYDGRRFEIVPRDDKGEK